MKSVPTQDCLRKSFNTHLRKMLTRRLRPKQNSLRNFSTGPFLYKPRRSMYAIYAYIGVV